MAAAPHRCLNPAVDRPPNSNAHTHPNPEEQTDVKTVDHATIIAASPGTVWAILMDVDRYDEWNPFLQLHPAPPALERI